MRHCLITAIQGTAAIVSILIASGNSIAADPASDRGISFQNYKNRDVPWSIYVVRIDRARREFELTTSIADGTRLGLSTLTDQIRRLPKSLGKPIAAINGDFYRTEGERYPGDPRGLQISRGELISGPNRRTCFWVDTNGAPQMAPVTSEFTAIWPDEIQTTFGLNEERSSEAVLYTAAIGPSTETSGGVEYILEAVDPRKWLPLRAGETFPARVREIRRGGNSKTSAETLILSLSRPKANSQVGDILVISTKTTPSLSSVRTAIGGGPALVRGGKAQPARVSKAGERHPRSAFGWTKKDFVFVQVDGRQSHSDGMTLAEMSEFLVSIGCEEAMNLDGGASSEVWFDGQILNSPCWGRERSTANALVLIEKKETKP